MIVSCPTFLTLYMKRLSALSIRHYRTNRLRSPSPIPTTISALHANPRDAQLSQRLSDVEQAVATRSVPASTADQSGREATAEIPRTQSARRPRGPRSSGTVMGAPTPGISPHSGHAKTTLPKQSRLPRKYRREKSARTQDVETKGASLTHGLTAALNRVMEKRVWS